MPGLKVYSSSGMAFYLPLCPFSYDNHIIWFIYGSRRTLADLDHFVGVDDMILYITFFGPDATNHHRETCIIALSSKSL